VGWESGIEYHAGKIWRPEAVGTDWEVVGSWRLRRAGWRAAAAAAVGGYASWKGWKSMKGGARGFKTLLGSTGEGGSDGLGLDDLVDVEGVFAAAKAALYAAKN
jgi:hypothetical protein